MNHSAYAAEHATFQIKHGYVGPLGLIALHFQLAEEAGEDLEGARTTIRSCVEEHFPKLANHVCYACTIGDLLALGKLTGIDFKYLLRAFAVGTQGFTATKAHPLNEETDRCMEKLFLG